MYEKFVELNGLPPITIALNMNKIQDQQEKRPVPSKKLLKMKTEKQEKN
jgi:hypothetical protein